MTKIFDTTQIKQITESLSADMIGVLPTDTIYGLHAKVTAKNLEKIRELKNRELNMPFIYVVSNVDQLNELNIDLTKFDTSLLTQYWPGPNTLILPTTDGQTQAIRLPKYPFIIEILNSVGPLISTSANLHGSPFAKNVTEAQGYFGDTVDFYVDAGQLNNAPSSIYKLSDKNIEKIR